MRSHGAVVAKQYGTPLLHQSHCSDTSKINVKYFAQLYSNNKILQNNSLYLAEKVSLKLKIKLHGVSKRRNYVEGKITKLKKIV